MREVSDAELNAGVAAMTQLNRNFCRYQRGLEGDWDWPDLSEDQADKLIESIFDVAEALGDLAAEVEGFGR